MNGAQPERGSAPSNADGDVTVTRREPNRSRVLVVAPQPFFQDRGTPQALLHVVRALAALGHGVDILAFPGGTSPEIPGVRYFRVPNPLGLAPVRIGFSLRKLWFDVFLFFALRTRLRRHRYRYVHAVEEAAFLAVVLARRYRTPVLYDMQSSMAEQMAGRWLLRNRWARRWLFSMERWLVRRADQTMASVGLVEPLRAQVPETTAREWWYPGGPVAVERDRVKQLRADLDIAPDRRVVLYLGNFEEYQGIPILLDAAPMIHARVPDALLLLVGAEGAQRDETGARLAASLPADAYRVVPRQPRGVVADYLALAEVVVSPRVYGGNLPIKILDYLAAGRAIVATGIAAHRAVLDDWLAQLTDPTAEGLAEGVTHVLTDPTRAAVLRAAATKYAETHLGWDGFVHRMGALYRELCPDPHPPTEIVSVVIPARNEALTIGRLVEMVSEQRVAGAQLEIIVVDDGSTDGTATVARAAGAIVVTRTAGDEGNPAAARNQGAAVATGDPIVFLDADCTPRPHWLESLVAAHGTGLACVGGSLAMPRGLSATARWDYYCGWYHAHAKRPGGPVRHHPPCNLSVRAGQFAATSGFVERQPIAYAHEELEWQAELQRRGEEIYFETRAVVDHWNRPGFFQLLRRNYRWAYSAIESKADTGIARASWIYRYPRLLMFAGLLLSPLQAMYIIWCWLRAGVLEPLLVFPVMILARVVYGAGMLMGGMRWWRRRGTPAPPARPRWV